jgi:hypothetical protein
MTAPTNSKATASFVMALSGLALLVCCGLGALLSVPAAITGHIARREARRNGELGEGYATMAILFGWFGGIANAAVIVGLVVLLNRAQSVDLGNVTCWFVPCDPMPSPG